MKCWHTILTVLTLCFASPALADWRTVEFEADNIDLAIPDEGGPVADFHFELLDRGLVYNMTVELRITHTYIGDLIVKLVSPAGDEVVLHERTGGSTEDIAETYDQNTSDFSALRDRPITGEWHLVIDDEAGGDVGRLDYLRLTIDRI